MKGYFIAGTDTGVGKTQVAAALCALLARRGLRPVPLKPVETGCAPEAPEDALGLRAACGPPASALALDRVCPYRFRLPAAPLPAAEAEGRQVDLRAIEAVAALAEGPLVVEAAGGLLVPLARETASGSLEQVDSAQAPPAQRLLTNLDLAARLGLPVLLVGRAGLGTQNHCALSVLALERRGLAVLAVLLNRTVPDDDPSVVHNPQFVAELTGARVLGPAPFLADEAERRQALGALLATLLPEGEPGRGPVGQGSVDTQEARR